MPLDQELGATPPRPRMLRTVKGARLELSRLYHQVKTGEIPPDVASRCTAILNALIASNRDHVFDERIAAIEQRINDAKPNGLSR